ncbi:hypothetical protein BLNAU_4817 [Blattamonas nauphoetae]|uniref:Transmembrane protein n=1 Tax=Blattamonas nauphoetae TaxID=2049346 RepID=A0ABQ9Y985_9EUKA|nr:hypothetical protein BLNAU_4817 [Blattamonas nauphoetae]
MENLKLGLSQGFAELLQIISASYPYLFVFQTVYYTVCLSTGSSSFHSFFLTLFVNMFGSTIVPLFIFQETPGWLKDSKYFYLFAVTWIVTQIVLKAAPKLLRNKVSVVVLNFGLELSISQIILNYLLKTSAKFPNAEFVICVLIGFICGSLPHILFLRKQPEAHKYDSTCLSIASGVTVTLFTIIRRPNLLISPFLSLPFLPTGPRLEGSGIPTKIFSALRNFLKSRKKVMELLKLLHSYNTRPTDIAISLFGRGPKYQIPLFEIPTLKLRQLIGLSALAVASLYFAFMTALDYARESKARKELEEETRHQRQNRPNRSHRD